MFNLASVVSVGEGRGLKQAGRRPITTARQTELRSERHLSSRDRLHIGFAPAASAKVPLIATANRTRIDSSHQARLILAPSCRAASARRCRSHAPRRRQLVPRSCRPILAARVGQRRFRQGGTYRSARLRGAARRRRGRRDRRACRRDRAGRTMTARDLKRAFTRASHLRTAAIHRAARLR
jgi:hypothetical protein